MAAVVAWWLNLDVELELENPTSYRLDPRVRERIVALLPRLRALLGPDAVVIGQDPLPRDCAALAWSPSPSAIRAISAAGLPIPAHPPLDVLRHVNHRSFSAALGQTLPGAEQVATLERLERCVRKPSPTGDWVIKRPFGFAGRERRRAIAGVLDESTRGFAASALARGETLQVEPWVKRCEDLSQHAWLARDGSVQVAAAVAQRCDVQGRWQGSGGPAQLAALHAHTLQRELERAANALHQAGYFGPFGVDAYLYLDARGALQLNPRSEINARFTMGYQWPPGVDPHAL